MRHNSGVVLANSSCTLNEWAFRESISATASFTSSEEESLHIIKLSAYKLFRISFSSEKFVGRVEGFKIPSLRAYDKGAYTSL